MTDPISKSVNSKQKLHLEIQDRIGFRGSLSIAGLERYTGRVDALYVIIIHNIDPNQTDFTLHNK